MGTYEVIDFVAMLLGYASSGEGTLKQYAERLRPFGAAMQGLFEADLLARRLTGEGPGRSGRCSMWMGRRGGAATGLAVHSRLARGTAIECQR